ncbi:helix-turn-helix transcriptional regulator [Streptomyces sp. CC208A]|uniref:helix-turn-helix transcriptional regulator n=1 Tax=Streptomyces sp. CC208A TaxID=3044573 RepID=UPI0024A7E2AF|nr:helix-turn-helix transcriptional regulator [Streptomyces sp. CC208A]
MSAPVTDRAGQARAAVAREAWAEAYTLLHARDRHPDEALTADDLSALSDAAWWSGHVEESVTARLRAHAAHVAAGDHRGAGTDAWWLHYEYAGLGRPAVAAGWLHRARHHLDGLPPCPEQTFLAWTDAEEATARGDTAAALAAAERMTRLAERSGDPDLLALSRQATCAVLLAQGRRTEGLGLLDEAMCAAEAGELSSFATGWLYCLALTQCMEAADLGRAAEWTRTAMEWCATTGTGENPFRGVCRAHRVEVLDLLGEWPTAEEEAARACREVPVDCLEAAAAAYCVAGDVQRRQGRLDEATRSYAHAHELGRLPQPGLALLRLAQGRAAAAEAGLRLALACQDGRQDPLARARLLAARTEVALAVGAVREAADAAAELDVLAGEVPLLRAFADTAAGAVALASGPEEALPVLRRALDGWLRLRVPYEAAQVRMLIAAADRAAGDEEAARLELAFARDGFGRLGAGPDARRAAALLSAASRRRLPGGLTAREAEVLRLVAQGATNKGVARTLVISEHTVARHLNNVFAKLGVSSRAAATAYASAHGLV